MAILQVFVWAILTLKGKRQIAGAQNLETIVSYNIEMLYILTFRGFIYVFCKISCFVHFFRTFGGKFQAMSGSGMKNSNL